MKCKYLKNQNESFRKQIEEQSQLINSQTILIDKLTKEKIDLLSKLEIKNINYKKFRKPIDALELQMKCNMAGHSNIDGIIGINVYDRINPLKEKTIIMSGSSCGKTTAGIFNNIILDIHKNAFSNAVGTFINAFDEIYLGENDEVFGSIKRTENIKENIKEENSKTIKVKSKDWYQKHNNKQKFQGRNK